MKRRILTLMVLAVFGWSLTYAVNGSLADQTDDEELFIDYERSRSFRVVRLRWSASSKTISDIR